MSSPGRTPAALAAAPMGKRTLRQVVLVERDACATSDDQRGILSGLIDAIPDAGERTDDRQQKRWDPDQLEEDQPTTRQVGDAVGQAKLRPAGSFGAHCGIRRHDSVMPPKSVDPLISIWRPAG